MTIEHRADQNILLITIDTLRADALGSYGGQALTPNLDQLAGEGIRFDFAHAHAVLTRPSHTSILTGLYPYEHGVRDHSGYRMKAGTATIATVLKHAGFATGAFVGGVPVAKQFGLGEGFDVYDDRFGRTGNNSDFSLAERPAGEVIAPALTWIRAQPGRWFAWVHLFDPHAPYAPPPPFDREYVQKPYLGEVAYVDQALRPLIDTVRGSARPTLVLVTSDHGEGLGDHGELTHGLFAYESTLHVPMILAQLSGRKSRGTVSHVPARHIDVIPTLLDAVDVPVPAGLQGRSLLPDRPQPAAADVSSYFEAMSAMLNRGWAPLQGVIGGREKYIELPQAELYDLAADPQEQSNLIERRAGSPPRPRCAAPRIPCGATGRAFLRIARGCGDTPVAGVHLRQRATEGAVHRAGRSEESHRAGSVDPAGHRGLAARPRIGSIRHLPAHHRTPAVDGHRLSEPCVAAVAERRCARRDSHARAGLPGGRCRTWNDDPARIVPGRGRAACRCHRPAAAAHDDDAGGSDALNALGIAYARAGSADKSSAIFRRALHENPENVQALENIGTLELQRGDLAAAERALEQAASLDPKSARAQNGLGVVAMKSNRPDTAFDHWKRAVELAPQDFDALYNLATELESAGRRDEARPYLERFAREAPAAQYGPDIERVKRILAQ